MKLAISNLAFPVDTSDEILSGFVADGLNGLEVAPSKIAPWHQHSRDSCTAYSARLADLGLEISSLQAIFFGVGDIALLQDLEAFERMRDQVRTVSRIGSWLGVDRAVFGSPKQRARGDLPEPAAFDLGAERLSVLADTAQEFGMVLGLEPVPPYYGGDFLPGWRDVRAMVTAVDKPGLRVHLDTGCVLLGDDHIGEAITACAEQLTHFQIAEPALGGFDAPVAHHAEAAEALTRVSYPGWVSIEMLEQPDPIEAARRAIRYAARTYQA